ncbi:MAG: Mitochondrial import inner membrane translocase subunit tim22 [Watsoniomyces obsoletus]|nr:MAG: Mitochondrial import inner membrane translocase subunit tim22 [Watsoniomyces obsoletus]
MVLFSVIILMLVKFITTVAVVQRVVTKTTINTTEVGHMGNITGLNCTSIAVHGPINATINTTEVGHMGNITGINCSSIAVHGFTMTSYNESNVKNISEAVTFSEGHQAGYARTGLRMFARAIIEAFGPLNITGTSRPAGFRPGLACPHSSNDSVPIISNFCITSAASVFTMPTSIPTSILEDTTISDVITVGPSTDSVSMVTRTTTIASETTTAAGVVTSPTTTASAVSSGIFSSGSDGGMLKWLGLFRLIMAEFTLVLVGQFFLVV